jgi:hypothetical protein
MKISIVIIEYHCMEDVLRCLESVEQHLGSLDHESIVLSNSCYGKGQIDSFRDRMDHMGKFVAAGANLGYAGGVNAALKEAGGEYVYILNPDCLLTDGNVASIIDEMERDPLWAIVGPKVVDDAGEIQPSCRRFPKPWTFLQVRSILSRLPGSALERERYLMQDFSREVQRNVDWVSGGAMLLKKSAIDRIGGMDERYFLYMEDVDWCRSAWEKGLKVVYCPASVVTHAGRHRSINAGLRLFGDRHLRWHLVSMARYFWKFRVATRPSSGFYLSNVT